VRSPVSESKDDATYLLTQGDMVTLETRTHASGTKSSLRNLPKPVYHGVEDKVVIRGSEAKAASEKIGLKRMHGALERNVLHNIIAILVKKEGRREGAKVLSNQCNLLRCLHTFNYLLSCPCAIFMNSDHGKRW
jgi:hypothetical protein